MAKDGLIGVLHNNCFRNRLQLVNKVIKGGSSTNLPVVEVE